MERYSFGLPNIKTYKVSTIKIEWQVHRDRTVNRCKRITRFTLHIFYLHFFFKIYLFVLERACAHEGVGVQGVG